MSHRICMSLALLTGGLVVTAPAQTPPSGAAPLRECGPGHPEPPTPGDRCFETEHAWFFTQDTAWARREIPATELAAARFERVFGKPVKRGMVVHVSTGDTRPGRVIVQRTPSSGAAAPAWTWHWITMPGFGAMNPLESGTNTHEMGHMWFDKAFDWPVQAGMRYGTPGADWLDETAAILMEDSDGRVNRRTNFLRNYRAQKSGGRTLVKPLDSLFTMKHPIDIGDGKPIVISDTTAFKATGDSGMAALQKVLAGAMEGLVKTSDDPVGANAFYEQCQLVIDFLVDRTKTPAIFGLIAENEAKGSNVQEWLRANGAKYNLPTTVAELEQEWQRWLADWAAKGDVNAPAAP